MIQGLNADNEYIFSPLCHEERGLRPGITICFQELYVGYIVCNYVFATNLWL